MPKIPKRKPDFKFMVAIGYKANVWILKDHFVCQLVFKNGIDIIFARKYFPGEGKARDLLFKEEFVREIRDSMFKGVLDYINNLGQK